MHKKKVTLEIEGFTIHIQVVPKVSSKPPRRIFNSVEYPSKYKPPFQIPQRCPEYYPHLIGLMNEGYRLSDAVSELNTKGFSLNLASVRTTFCRNQR